jgi:hypothetical protein
MRKRSRGILIIGVRHKVVDIEYNYKYKLKHSVKLPRLATGQQLSSVNRGGGRFAPDFGPFRHLDGPSTAFEDIRDYLGGCMLADRCRGVVFARVAMAAALGLALSLQLWSQAGSQGTVVVTVADSSGAVVPGATLSLVAKQTNDIRTAATTGAGTYTFVNLPIGIYKLTINTPGYAETVYDAVLVQASQVTPLNAVLAIGKTSQTVIVAAESTPVLETSSNEIGMVVDIKQIEDLPLEGRDLTQFSALVGGFNGTFNGLPSNDQGSNIDGVIGASSRMKFTGNVEPAVTPRLENIEQMTVQTDQLDLNSGFGQSSTQVNFVSRRGGNQFHGRIYDNYRNSALSANTWLNNASTPIVPRNKLIYNDFGGTLGGPILHDKLFFFGSFALFKEPGSFTATNDVFTSAAQSGIYTYTNATGAQQTVNVLAIANGSNPALPGAVNSDIATQFKSIDSAAASGSTTPTSNLNFDQLNWRNSSPTTTYNPAGRGDWTVSQNARMYLSWSMSYTMQPGVTAPTFPGSGFSNQTAGNSSKNYSSSYGFDYTFSPRLINQFKAGFLYNNTKYAYNAAPLYASEPSVNWNYPGASGTQSGPEMSGQSYQLPVTTYYPIFDASDSMTWEHGRHTIQYGFSWYREQDHYWNPPAGFPTYTLGLAAGDPALDAFTITGSTPTLPGASSAQQTEAQQLYAVLTGRISAVGGETAYSIKNKTYGQPGQIGEYPLDELSSAVGLFAEDSYKATPTLTLNYGLRWDFTGAQHDITGFYHSSSPAAIYGPSGIGNLFNPGSFEGDLNPQITTNARPYEPWKVTPQPAFGFAWNPKGGDGPLGKLLGGDSTVVRGGIALRRFTEPYQYFWNAATSYGSFYYQQFYLQALNTGQAGTFAPGSLSLGSGALPAYALSPAAYQATAPQSEFTFNNAVPVSGLNQNIKQPYSESWNFGLQRALGHSLALEVRYNGNRTIHQWVTIDPNEVNVFENGFLAEFKRAQANLAANGGNSFTSQGGQALPIFDAAFGGPSASDYTNPQYINYLQTGQVGAMANTLAGVAGTVPYFCNLVGAGFSPCATNAGYTGGGAGYPTNFFQANPYAAGAQSDYLVAAGYSNYNALQVDVRQGSWHGLQYDANYTWSHSLGVASNNSWTGSFNSFTLRNLAKSYGPTLFDLRNVLHASGTYDLPLGRGKQFLSRNGVVDKVVGGWTVGTIVTDQSGYPVQLTGGFKTFNDYGDGGVSLNGVTAAQLQKAVGVHRVPGQSFADLLNPKYLASTTGGGANPAYISPNTNPGTIGNVVYLHGPHAFFQDMSISKSLPIRERLNFKLQGEFLNVWNHPVFGNTPSFGATPGYFDTSINPSQTAGVQDYGFGLSGVTNQSQGFGRIIEVRGNFEF